MNPNAPILYANDSANISDGFGPSRAGDQVARMALEAQPPFTVCVTGKWGCGKTSVLRRAFVTLGGRPVQQDAPLRDAVQEADPEEWGRWAYDKRKDTLSWPDDVYKVAEKTLCVWYSPWQHQGADNPLVPLLLELRRQFSVWAKIKKGAKNLNRRGGLAGLALIERAIDGAAALALERPVKQVTGTSDAVRQAWREAAPAEPEISDGQRFHLLFEDAVETLVGKDEDDKDDDTGRLIFFIDDLDRCEEDVIVKLLEAIKLYLGTKRCVFVLGLDEGAVVSALRRHWQGRSEDSNREYLEKLFQVIVPVPPPQAKHVRESVARQFVAHEMGKGTAQTAAEMIEELLEPNPRRIKNFVNSVCASWNLYRRSRTGTKFVQRLILFQYLRTFHRDVWRLLERQRQNLRLLTRVLLGENDEVDLPEFVGSDQIVLRRLFFRSFAHVLRDDRGEPHEDYHGYLSLSDAVDLLAERIDRRRSDACFIRYYAKLIDRDDDLPVAFLHLREAG